MILKYLKGFKSEIDECLDNFFSFTENVNNNETKYFHSISLQLIPLQFPLYNGSEANNIFPLSNDII